VSAEVRREQLIEATIAVLRRDGLDGVTTRAIAAEAAAPLASIHYTFGSADDLVVAAFERLIDEVGERMSAGVNPRRGFGACIESVMQQVGSLLDDDRYRVLLGDLHPGSDERVAALEARYYRLARDLFDAVADATGREPAIARDQAARVVMAAIDGVMVQFAASGDVDAARSDLELFGRTLAGAIEPPALRRSKRA
jgi:DNA-binding transcriptional regulator YbjK